MSRLHSGDSRLPRVHPSEISWDDPYDKYVLQFEVLKQMGYPVAIDAVKRDESQRSFQADANYYSDEDWYDNHYRQISLRVTNTDFQPYINTYQELFDDSLEGAKAMEEADERRISEHLVKVLEFVQVPDLAHLASLLAESRKDRVQGFYHRQPALVSTAFFERVFVAATERQQNLIETGEPFFLKAKIDEETRVTYDQLVPTTRPFSLEDFGGLITDFYQTVEEVQPAILDFKH